ncbi:cytochrome P450 oxidoreductase-like protein [Phaeosphaeria sp. MPI-PUGE-AT-0046c]|nr:cytochrome P450 oxidoreductase-like protein [Phaeosphaeria sp. MPI-PUGE-AT-0046c]
MAAANHFGLLGILIPVLLASYFILKIARFGRRERHLPPGPPTLPIVGNAHLLAAGQVHIKLKELAEQYGSVFSLKIGKATMIVLNDPEAIFDLIHKKGALFVDRPQDQHWDLAYHNEILSLMHEGDEYKAMRKIAQQLLSPKNLDTKFHKIQEAEINRLILDLLEKPDEFGASIKRTSASIASIILYGFRASSSDSFWATAVFDTMTRFNETLSPGQYLPISQFPFLKYIPEYFVGSIEFAKQTYRDTTAVFVHARALVETRRRNGDMRESLADRLSDGSIQPEISLTNEQINSGILGASYQGAADTTSVHTLTNLLFLAKNPQIQDKAREQLDRVCGATRMPQWSDFENLPYINCIVKEGLRIRPVTPIGAPHCAKEDVWYKGMLIPKGATIIIPAYSLNFTYHTDPETYNPDRYLDYSKLSVALAASPDYGNRDHYTFGSGRRNCVGVHLAERSLWRMIAQILWAFKIEQAVDEHGKLIELDEKAYMDGFLLAPLPFKVRLVPRSKEHADVVRGAVAESEKYLEKWE